MVEKPPKFMGLQHAAIKVHDLEAAKDFYVNKLGFSISEIYPPGTVGGFPFGLCFMRCTALHHDLNLIFWPEGEGPGPPEGRSFETVQTGLHHIALQVENRRALEAWEAHLKEEGIEIFWGPSIHSPTHPEGDGFWGENHALHIFRSVGQLCRDFLRHGDHGSLHQSGERGLVPRSPRARWPPSYRGRPAGSVETLDLADFPWPGRLARWFSSPSVPAREFSQEIV